MRQLWGAFLDFTALVADPVARVLAAWAWPIAVLGVAVIFHGPLSWLIRSVRNIKTNVAEFSLLDMAREKAATLGDDAAPRDEADAHEAGPYSTAPDEEPPSDARGDVGISLDDDIRDYSLNENDLASPGRHHRFVPPMGMRKRRPTRSLNVPRHFSPEARVREADRFLRGELFRAWKVLKLQGATAEEILRSLVSEGVVEPEFRDAYTALRGYAKALSTNSLFVLDEDADDFVDTATVLVDHLRIRVKTRVRTRQAANEVANPS